MKFELNLDKGEWFPFFKSEMLEDGEVKYIDPEPDEPCRVKFRLADADFIEKMQAETRKEVVERVLNPKTRQMERIKDYDQTPTQRKAEREMVWGNAIMEWEGVLDVNEDEVSCTLENKMLMMNIPIFSRYAIRCLQLISGEASEEKEALRGN